MVVPGLEAAVLEASGHTGLELDLGSKVPWLSGRGHLDPVVAARAPVHVIEALSRIHTDLGGDSHALTTKRAGNPPTPDLVHTPTGTIIEIDEVQHFTTARLKTFDYYPATVELGFDLDHYRSLVRTWLCEGDKAYAHRIAADFPNPGGRQAQRAYNDALRDLLAPTFTGHPVIRIAIPDRRMDDCVEQIEAALPS